MSLTTLEQAAVGAAQIAHLEVSASKAASTRTLVALAEACLGGRRTMHVENCQNLASESLTLATDVARLVANETWSSSFAVLEGLAGLLTGDLRIWSES